LSALFYVTELTLSPVFGAISDLRGRRPILVLGPLLGAIAMLLYPLSALTSVVALSVGILGVTRLLEGVSTAAKVPSALGYLADATEGEGVERAALRGRVMGLYEISFLVGFVSGFMMGGVLWEALHVASFLMISLVYVVATLMLFFFVPESLPAEAHRHHRAIAQVAANDPHPVRSLLKHRLKIYVEVLKEPALRSFVPAWLAVNAVVGLMGNLVLPMLIEGKVGSDEFPNQLLYGKFSSSEAGFIIGGFGLVFMVGIYLWSLAYARIRKTTVMLIATGGLFTLCVALAGINNHWISGPWGGWVLVPLLVLSIFSVSGFTPVALAYLAEISGTRVEHRGAVMGLYSVFLGIGQLIGSGGGGFFVKNLNQGFNGIIIGTMLLGMVALLSVLWLRTRHKV
jgi:MFS family permease